MVDGRNLVDETLFLPATKIGKALEKWCGLGKR
jgi:hypothetical protein